MTVFQPTASPAIERPTCPKCGTKMMLSRIAPEKPGYDTRSFECTKCNHEESLVVKFR